jgi:hypothetical protein
MSTRPRLAFTTEIVSAKKFGPFKSRTSSPLETHTLPRCRRASIRPSQSPASRHRVAVRQWQLLPRRQDTQFCSRHRPQTENHTGQWNGRSLRPHDQAELCPRQSVPGCRHRHAPAISLDQSLQRGSPAQGARISFTPRVHRSSRKSLTVSGRSGGHSRRSVQKLALDRAGGLKSVNVLRDVKLRTAPP